MPKLSAPPCLGPESDDPNTSFLHLEELSKIDKARWVGAAAAAKMTLAEWVQRELNQAAARETAPPVPPVKS